MLVKFNVVLPGKVFETSKGHKYIKLHYGTTKNESNMTCSLCNCTADETWNSVNSNGVKVHFCKNDIVKVSDIQLS